MGQVLGAPASATAPSQRAATSALAGMTPRQMYGILRDLRQRHEADPAKFRDVLAENPHLTKALFQAQLILGMVNPEIREPLPDVLPSVSAQAQAAPAPAPQVRVNRRARVTDGQQC